MSQSHDGVDEVGFIPQACEEEIAICSVTVGFDVLLR
jgi:hypothetical protein